MQEEVLELGALFREVGLDKFIEFQRNNQPDRFEPWQIAPVRGKGKVQDLYRVLHLGESLSQQQVSLSSREIDLLLSTGFIAESNGKIKPNQWRLTCFRGNFCVSDYNPDAGASVYVGDDSLLFSDFLMGLPRCGNSLDIGFGSGISSSALAGRCDTVTGIDVVPKCLEAGQVTATLNGFNRRSTFYIEGVESFSPKEKLDLVAGNPPGVPVPEGIQYGLAGKGGKDGLTLVRSFFEAAQDMCRPDGMVAMRFQSISDSTGIVAHREIVEQVQAQRWDVQLYVDISIPIEVRTALSVQNALPLNSERNEQELFERFDNHMKIMNTCGYTSSLMLLRLNGTGQCSVSSVGIPVDFDAELIGATLWDKAAIDTARSLFTCYIGNSPGILWRIANLDRVLKMIVEFTEIAQLFQKSSTPREVYRTYLRMKQMRDGIAARSLIIPIQLVATALLEAGCVSEKL